MRHSGRSSAIVVGSGLVLAGALVFAQHPRPQPRPAQSLQCPPPTPDPGVSPQSPAPQCEEQPPGTTLVITGEGFFPPQDPYLEPPGSNFLPTVYTNMFDGLGQMMPNTLPSTPDTAYNLHPTPTVSTIPKTSPTDDLHALFYRMAELSGNATELTLLANLGLDILEGNPLNGEEKCPKWKTQPTSATSGYSAAQALRALSGEESPERRQYSCYPLLHYTGPNKVVTVDKETKTINVNQIWYDIRIESDTSLIDPRYVLDDEWTINYTVDVLNRGHDDFSPFVIYTDTPQLTDSYWKEHGTPDPQDDAHLPGGRLPHIGMDQTFFPMEDGTRTVFKIKMTPGKYYNLTYTWGWRAHPPRIQATENALKKVVGLENGQPVKRNLVEWATSVFGEDPTAGQMRSCQTSGDPRGDALAKIGNLAPAKRMWNLLCDIRRRAQDGNLSGIGARIEQAANAFGDWKNRSQLPAGVDLDPTADLTLFYVNNTIYAQFTRGGIVNFPSWTRRGATLKVTLLNGDYFDHGYTNVDFGGARGWENQFKSSVKIGGSGCWFTFGRAHWWVNNSASSPIIVPAALPGSSAEQIGRHRVNIVFNYEPSRRLRFYQFDPMHHDVAIYSIH